MPNRKSQVAMEFLMTYGWAILAVLTVLGVLIYFGVLDSKTVWQYLPKKCDLPYEIYCRDFEMYYDGTTFPPTNVLKLNLRNSGGNQIQITHIQIANLDENILPPLALQNGKDIIREEVGLTPLNGNTQAIPVGSPYQITFTITYKNTESGLLHSSSATIRGPAVLQYS